MKLNTEVLTNWSLTNLLDELSRKNEDDELFETAVSITITNLASKSSIDGIAFQATITTKEERNA